MVELYFLFFFNGKKFYGLWQSTLFCKLTRITSLARFDIGRKEGSKGISRNGTNSYTIVFLRLYEMPRFYTCFVLRSAEFLSFFHSSSLFFLFSKIPQGRAVTVIVKATHTEQNEHVKKDTAIQNSRTDLIKVLAGQDFHFFGTWLLQLCLFNKTTWIFWQIKEGIDLGKNKSIGI